MPRSGRQWLSRRVIRHAHGRSLRLAVGASPRSDFVGKDLKAFERIGAEGRDDGDIRGVAPSRYEDAPNARHVIARIERIPSTAYIHIEPRGQIHHSVWRRHSDIA